MSTSAPHACMHVHSCQTHVFVFMNMYMHTGCGEYCEESGERWVVRDTLGGRMASSSKAEGILTETQRSDCP